MTGAIVDLSTRALFLIAGATYTLDEMLAVNAEDEDVCDWLKTADLGDVCPLGGERVERVS